MVGILVHGDDHFIVRGPLPASGAPPPLAYAACFFCFAHRARWAAATLARPSADMARFFVGTDFNLFDGPGWSTASRRAVCSG
jgi:hypothetical protein